MDEDLQIDLEEGQNINKTENRIKSLAAKVAEEARGKEEAQAKTAEAEARALAAEKSLEFVNAFSEVTSKYQGATEFRTEIEEKVSKGYSIEDATVSVLNANGKLIPQVEGMTVAPITQAGGGSAPTVLPNSNERTAHEMSQDERREELLKPERAADIERILRQGF